MRPIMSHNCDTDKPPGPRYVTPLFLYMPSVETREWSESGNKLLLFYAGPVPM